MNVLVLGGTRFFGKTLVDQLVAAGHAVTVLSRGTIPPPEGATHLVADRTDPAALASALSGRAFDAVVDNVAMSADHVGAALDALGDRVGHYVLTSSVSVYGDFEHGVLHREAELDVETLGRDPPDGHPYTIGKRRAELILFRGERSRVPFTVVRPGYVVGPHDHLRRMQYFLARIRGGVPVVMPSGAGEIFQLAWHADVARAMARVLGDAATFGRAYNLAGTELFTYPTLVRALSAACGVAPRCVEIPRPVLRRGVLANESLPFGEEGAMWACDTARMEIELGVRATPSETWMKELAGAPLADGPPGEAKTLAAERAIARRWVRPIAGATSRLGRAWVAPRALVLARS